MKPTLKLLRELIALPSVNPSLTTAGNPHAGERRMGEFLAATAAAAGLDVDFMPVLPERSNLFAQLTPAGKITHRVLLVPHLDTVNVVRDDQFAPQLRRGRLYGRGACDTKGCVATMMSALIQLAKSNRRPAQTEIIFIGTVDEESGLTGSRAVADSGLKADLAIVGEPTRLQIVTAHKGNLWLKLETRGKAAHGAKPELGRNAVHEMARVVDLLETKYAAQLRQRRHPLLRHGTVNVGAISGGTQANIVPAHCAIMVDRRTLPGETDHQVRSEIHRLLLQHGLRAELTNLKAGECLPMETDPTLPLVQQFMTATAQRTPAGVDYFCDASVLARGGIPSVVFGPGDIAQAHTADEWISVSQLEQGKDLLVKFLSALP